MSTVQRKSGNGNPKQQIRGVNNTMQELLSKMINHRIDIYCSSTANLRGEVMKVESHILHLKDENKQTCYVAIDKIVAIWEINDEHDHRAGFVFGSLNNP